MDNAFVNQDTIEYLESAQNVPKTVTSINQRDIVNVKWDMSYLMDNAHLSTGV